MNIPYIWACHKCGKSNKPNTFACASCGFPAIASEADINPETESEKNQRRERESNISSNIVLFFPEGLVAAFLALISPFWAINLFYKGHTLAAFCLVSSVGACGYSFVWAARKQRKYVAYCVIVCFLLAAWGIDALLTS